MWHADNDRGDVALVGDEGLTGAVARSAGSASSIAREVSRSSVLGCASAKVTGSRLGADQVELRMPGIDHPNLVDIVFQHPVHWFPVHPGRFHPDQRHTTLDQPGAQRRQLRHGSTELRDLFQATTIDIRRVHARHHGISMNVQKRASFHTTFMIINSFQSDMYLQVLAGRKPRHVETEVRASHQNTSGLTSHQLVHVLEVTRVRTSPENLNLAPMMPIGHARSNYDPPH